MDFRYHDPCSHEQGVVLLFAQVWMSLEDRVQSRASRVWEGKYGYSHSCDKSARVDCEKQKVASSHWGLAGGREEGWPKRHSFLSAV